jgi:hypothetical protein
MTDFSEEQRAEAYRIRMIPLEEALAYATKPVYGLTEEVFGLQHDRHSWRLDGEMFIAYRSPLYAQYAFRNDETFVVQTRIIEEGKKVAFGLFRSSIEAARVAFDAGPDINPEFVELFEAKEKSVRIAAEKAALNIDGDSFKGSILHYTAPVRYSRFTFHSERVGLQGEALGPSIEELIQILESLHVLNGKEVE